MSVLTCQNDTACHLSASGFRLATTHNSRLNNFKCECGAKVLAPQAGQHSQLLLQEAPQHDSTTSGSTFVSLSNGKLASD
jgi:hypothetical protein